MRKAWASEAGKWMRRPSSRCTGPFRIFTLTSLRCLGAGRRGTAAVIISRPAGAIRRAAQRRESVRDDAGDGACRGVPCADYRPSDSPGSARVPFFWYAEAVLLEHNRPPQKMQKPRFRAVPLAVAAPVFIDTMPSIECSWFSTPQWLRTISLHLFGVKEWLGK